MVGLGQGEERCAPVRAQSSGYQGSSSLAPGRQQSPTPESDSDEGGVLDDEQLAADMSKVCAVIASALVCSNGTTPVAPVDVDCTPTGTVPFASGGPFSQPLSGL